MTPRSARYARTLALLACALFAFSCVAPAHAQDRSAALPRTSPNATVGQTVGVTDVRLTYGRPSARGRTVFGGLVPYGEVWRTGANEATTISFADDVRVEGEPLAAGTYGLFTIPGEETWTLVFNDVAEQWGAYEYDASEDVLRVEVAPRQAPHAHEQLTFHVGATTDTSTTIALLWEDVRVPFTIQTDTDANVRAAAEEAAAQAEDWQAPLRYAAYALQNGLYPEAALGWADRSIALEENYRNTSTRALLLASMERYGEARQAAGRALTLAEGMDEAPRGLARFEETVEGWPSE